QHEAIPRKTVEIAKANNEDSFAVLRYEAPTVDDLPVDRVPEFVSQYLPDSSERSSAVMTREILDVLQQESLWLVVAKHSRDFEEKRALCLARKSVGSPERVFLANASDGKWLTRETGEQNVVGWNNLGSDLHDVASYGMR